MLHVPRRRVLLLVGGTLVVAAGWSLYATLFGRPLCEAHLEQRVAFELYWDDPDMVARGGIGDGSFWDRWSRRFTDNSPARSERSARKRRLRALLRSCPLPAPGTKERLSREIVDWYLDSEVRGEPFRYHDYLVDSYGGAQASVLEILTELHPLAKAGGAEAYVARLRAVPAKVDGILAGLRYRADRGIVAPRWSLEKVANEVERFVAPPPRENVLCTTFARKTEPSEGLSAARRAALVARAGDHLLRLRDWPAGRAGRGGGRALRPAARPGLRVHGRDAGVPEPARRGASRARPALPLSRVSRRPAGGRSDAAAAAPAEDAGVDRCYGFARCGSAGRFLVTGGAFGVSGRSSVSVSG